MGGLWLEFKTPGFGIFGLLGGICLILFFFGHHIAGLSGMEDVLFFIIGITLIGIEIFVTPGLGFLGIGGLLLMLASLINAMSERLPGSWQPISWDFQTFTTPIVNVAIAFGGSLILAIITGKYLPKTKVFSSLTLNETITNNINNDKFIDKEGFTLCELRPSGSAIIEGEKVDVISQGEFISQGSKVKIVSKKGIAYVVDVI